MLKRKSLKNTSNSSRYFYEDYTKRVSNFAHEKIISVRGEVHKTKVGEYIRMEPFVIIETQPDLDGEYFDNLMFNCSSFEIIGEGKEKKYRFTIPRDRCMLIE